MEEYHLENSSIYTKYKTKAAFYYRKMLENELSGQQVESKPDFEKGQEIEQTKQSTQDYYSFGSDNLVQDKRQQNVLGDQLNKGKDSMIKLGSFFTSKVNDLYQSTKKITTDQNSSLKNFSQKVGHGIIGLGKSVKNIAKTSSDMIIKQTSDLLSDSQNDMGSQKQPQQIQQKNNQKNGKKEIDQEETLQKNALYNFYPLNDISSSDINYIQLIFRNTKFQIIVIWKMEKKNRPIGISGDRSILLTTQERSIKN